MIVCTDKVQQIIREYLPRLKVKNPERIISPLMATFYGTGVHVLPEGAFVGMVDDDGEEVNLLSVNRAWENKVLEYWEALQDGRMTLKDLALEEIEEVRSNIPPITALKCRAMMRGNE